MFLNNIIHNFNILFKLITMQYNLNRRFEEEKLNDILTTEIENNFDTFGVFFFFLDYV